MYRERVGERETERGEKRREGETEREGERNECLNGSGINYCSLFLLLSREKERKRERERERERIKRSKTFDFFLPLEISCWSIVTILSLSSLSLC